MQAVQAADPAAVARVLRDAPFPWWLAGGCALDQYVGGVIRPRKDVDVAILRRDQARLRSFLAGWEFAVAIGDGELVRLRADQWLEPPLHEIWARPGPGGGWLCEFLLSEASSWEWIYRRDARITLPLAALMTGTTSSRPIPILPPEIVLLYKAGQPRAEDEVDFQAVLPHLSTTAAAWLLRALRTFEPGHSWCGRLAGRDG